MIPAAIAAIPLAIWLYLLLGHGAFWRASERDDAGEPAGGSAWPSVTVVIPARDEAACVAQSVGSLLRQDYPGAWRLILVDDNSTDGTAALARATAAEDGPQRLRILAGETLPRGWTGKLWAMKQGIDTAQGGENPPDYLLLTDADIVYQPDVLKRLVTRAEAQGLVLTSLMVKLRCESLAERALIPAFIFFFQKLYPFVWVNRAHAATAAAAGGCMLVRSEALQEAGGIEAIRGALIDDCALAKRMKAVGPIWLGLTERVHSIRPYPNVDDIRHMVARSAYAQLQYSPLLLAGTVAGLGLTYLLPPLLAIFAGGLAQTFGIAAWLLMAIAFQPTLRLYRMSPLWGLALPAIALCYLVFTLDSALQFARGRGGLWKGRVQAT
jgi:hopene-associated glycosyltransferase HpnB